MGDFTDKDRERLIETHTLVKTIHKQVEDHETRIRKNESIAAKAVGYAVIVGMLTTGAVQAFIKKISG